MANTPAVGVSFYQCDISSVPQVRNVAARIRENHGHPTMLINNAGIGRVGTVLEKSEADIRAVFEVNILAHFWTVKEFVPDMVRKNHGHIITIASIASFVSTGEIVDYACSKAAALALHEGITQELMYWHGAKKVHTRYTIFSCCDLPKANCCLPVSFTHSGCVLR